MSVDRLSNMLSALKNAVLAGNEYIETYHSKECENVAKVLKDEGFLSEVKTFKFKDKKYKGLRLELAKSEEGGFKISEIKRVSKPGRRMYAGNDDLKPLKAGHGVTVVSTSRGVMSGAEARKKKLGGEVICRVF